MSSSLLPRFLPTYRGFSGGREVIFIVTEARDGDWADALGGAQVNKLENARGTRALMKLTVDDDGTVHFPVTVDFSPERVVVGDPEFGFSPLEVAPGSIGEKGYSPLIELPDGTIMNAPHLHNDSGLHDSMLKLSKRKTYAPALNFAPGLGNDGSDSSRSSQAAITNGQTGADNPERQGLNSALLGDGSPRNMLAWLPNQGR